MQNYPVRASHRANLSVPALAEMVRSHFGAPQVEGDAVRATYGAISEISARANGRELGVEVTMNPKVSDEVAADTIRRYNQFLEAVTGYSSKERAKRLRKSASGKDTGA